MSTHIANARMYAVTPGVEQVWRTLLLRIAALAEVPLTYTEHAAPQPIATLWERTDLGMALMCGLPYITRVRQTQTPPVALAAPVPSLARYQAQPLYFTEFIARQASGFTTLKAACSAPRPVRLAHMLPESNSGYNAPRFHVMQCATTAPEAAQAFQPTAQPTPTPQAVINAVLDDQADIGVIDSYVLDLLRHHAPDSVSSLITLETTMASPIPLLVAAPDQPPVITERLRQALLVAHEDAVCQTAMQSLLLTRFAPTTASAYDVLLQRQAAAHRFVLTAAVD